MHRTQISVDEELMALARLEADSRGISFSELCRQGLRRLLGQATEPWLLAEPTESWQVSRVLRVDDAGRVLVPKPLRDSLGLSEGTRVEARVDGRRLVLVPLPDSAELIEVAGLLVAAGPGGETWPDHRDLREERIAQLGKDP